MEPAQALAFALTEALGGSVPIVVDPKDSRLSCSPGVIHIEITGSCKSAAKLPTNPRSLFSGIAAVFRH
jgi:hypothetical protein